MSPSTTARLWAVLAGANDAQQFCQSWLAIQCRLIPAVEGGLVLLLIETDGSYAPAAVWPDVRRDMSYLTHAAQQRADRRSRPRCPAERANASTATASTSPIPSRPSANCAAWWSCIVVPASRGELQAALRQLHWGAAGVEVLFVRDEVYRARIAPKPAADSVLELVAPPPAHDRFSAAATALATELATRLHCERVSIGFLRGNKVHVDAVSHSAQFKERTNLLRSVAAAMEEAIDQGMPVRYPPRRTVRGDARARGSGQAHGSVQSDVSRSPARAKRSARSPSSARPTDPFDARRRAVRSARRTGRSIARGPPARGPMVPGASVLVDSRDSTQKLFGAAASRFKLGAFPDRGGIGVPGFAQATIGLRRRLPLSRWFSRLRSRPSTATSARHRTRRRYRQARPCSPRSTIVSSSSNG